MPPVGAANSVCDLTLDERVTAAFSVDILAQVSSRETTLHALCRNLHDEGGAAASRVLSNALRRVLSIKTVNGRTSSCARRQLFPIQTGVYEVLLLAWEKLHTGRWADAQFIWRELYGLCAILYTEIGLFDALSKKRPSLVHTGNVLDNAAMLGCYLFRNEIETIVAGKQTSFPRSFSRLNNRDRSRLPPSKATTRCLQKGARHDSWKSDAVWQLGTKCGDLLGKCHLVTAGRKTKPLPFGSLAIGTHPLRKPVQHLASAPSLDLFIHHLHINRVRPGVPVLISGDVSRWDAVRNWRSLCYLRDMCGNRTAPVEFGKHYLSDNWSQELMPFSDFLNDHLRPTPPQAKIVDKAASFKYPCREHKYMDPSQKIEQLSAWDSSQPPGRKTGYVAQHSLFEQIPVLLDDFNVPAYCTPCGSATSGQLKAILAWIGPSGTISPLHTDPYHNLLTQVVGYKYVRLYPRSHVLAKHAIKEPKMNNSSDIDFNQSRTNFEAACGECVSLAHTDLILGPGDALYMPPDHWHYVHSLTSSISVSFWWLRGRYE